MTDDVKEGLVIAGGIAFVVLSIGAMVSVITWSAGTYGNQLAKKCIAAHQSWVLVDPGQHQYECRK